MEVVVPRVGMLEVEGREEGAWAEVGRGVVG